MKKIKFEYNLIKDAYVYASVILFSVSFGIKNTKNLALIPRNVQKEVKKIYAINPISHSKLLTVSNHPIFKPIVDYLKSQMFEVKVKEEEKRIINRWKNVEQQYFSKLSEILQKPIYQTDYKCYLTTLFRCPCYYEGGWFMVSAFSKLPNQIYVICHEFMHLQFIHWYREYCLKKGLTKSEFQDLKEAITFILNEPEFSGLISFKDKGYLLHKKLRKDLKSIWRKNKNFQIFLDGAIEIIKSSRK